MNLSKLFEIQSELDKPYQDVPDRLSKDILWLMTEIGELANEWRGFRYRRPVSEQTPVTDIGFKTTPSGIQMINPLLNEYTDALSVLLSIGNSVDYDYTENCQYLHEYNVNVYMIGADDVVDQFNSAFGSVIDFHGNRDDFEMYEEMFCYFLALGKMMGLEWDKIETAYIEKAEANKRRNAHA